MKFLKAVLRGVVGLAVLVLILFLLMPVLLIALVAALGGDARLLHWWEDRVLDLGGWLYLVRVLEKRDA